MVKGIWLDVEPNVWIMVFETLDMWFCHCITKSLVWTKWTILWVYSMMCLPLDSSEEAHTLDISMHGLFYTCE